MNTEKIIIDTDIGDFIDDTLALCFALKSKELEVVGVTTVFKHVTARAKLALHLLKELGRSDIPVVPGIGIPLANEPVSTLYDCIDDTELPRQYMKEMKTERITVSENAVDFIAKRLIESRESITLVALGPLTNIATLLVKYPNVMSKIKRIIIMGGAFYINRSEYNVMCDPEATKVVFESSLDILCVGLDVTTKCQLTEKDLLQMKTAGTRISNMLYDLIDRFIKQTNHIPCLHDPLALAVAIDSSLVSTEHIRVGVECGGEFSRGITVTINLSKST